MRVPIAAWLVLQTCALAQYGAGTLEVELYDSRNLPAVGQSVRIEGGAGLVRTLTMGAAGQAAVRLPYGDYRLSIQSSAIQIQVAPSQTTRVKLVSDGKSLKLLTEPESANPWISPAFATLAWPDNFTGLNDNRLPVMSQGAASWTATLFQLNGVEAGDTYQPGHPLMLPDAQAAETVVAAGEVGVFLRHPGPVWHAAVETADSGSFLASSNLPAAGQRGLLQQNQQYRWLSRQTVQAGGPTGQRADLIATVTSQQSDQTVPIASPGVGQRSGMAFVNVDARYHATDHDQVEALFSGSRLALSDFGIPAGLEALVGRRLAPQFLSLYGFPGESETDNLGALQVGWAHFFAESSPWGLLQARYGFTAAHFDTSASGTQSSIELFSGVVSGAAPLANRANRNRQELGVAWFPSSLHRHQIGVTGSWQVSNPENRFSVPDNLNVITAGGAPAFAVEFQSPSTSRSMIHAFSLAATDHIRLGRGFTTDLGLTGDFWRGSVAGTSLSWNSLSPRAAVAFAVPHYERLVFRLGYTRVNAPLAGRYLDYANADSLSGQVYRWVDSNSDGRFEPGEEGPMVLRFGGRYSSIAAGLRRPFADEFHAQAQLEVIPSILFSIMGFRRDDWNRIAALDVGIPDSAYTPVSIVDPLTSRRLTVYQQNAATFGQDRYLLTNPAGLRSSSEGFTAGLSYSGTRLFLLASFNAEKSFGPTNPGNSILENDPGVVGALFQDPNGNINNDGRSFLDPGFQGRIEGRYRLAGFDLSATALYVDGLVFARLLPVTGLAQGPFLVQATPRQNIDFPSGGGYRSLYVANANLRVLRRFRLSKGTLAAFVDVFNIANGGNAHQQSAFESTLRAPVSVQEPRWIELHLRYEF